MDADEGEVTAGWGDKAVLEGTEEAPPEAGKREAVESGNFTGER